MEVRGLSHSLEAAVRGTAIGLPSIRNAVRMGPSAAKLVPCRISPSHSKPSSRSLRLRAATTTPASAEAQTTPFAKVRTREELFQLIQAASLPQSTRDGMIEFFESYEGAVKSSGRPDAEEVSLNIMKTVFDRVAVQMVAPYTFPSYHESIREPFDYYQFGQNYIQPLIDYKNSYVGNCEIFDKIVEQLAMGHNVILLANHQTEGDPGVMALMLEKHYPSLATSLTYVAGDRVVLDTFCKPFSMGRNLLCVHSKKRINDIPELTESKLAANRRTLKEMTKLFKKGGNFVWVAPSGGRDRPDPDTDEWTPAAFDPSAVELMRRLAAEAGRPYHLHPLALLCYDIMPPPKKVEKELGEKRIIGHHGVGISVAPQVDFEAVTAGTTDRKEARDVFSRAVFNEVVKHYNVLFEATHKGKGMAASTEDIKLTQPFA